MIPANGIHKLTLTALGTEEVQPQIQLKTATVVLKPVEYKISALSGTRDVIPEGRQIYQNLLTYSFNVSKPQEVSLQAPVLSSVLYESEFESQFWMLFDSNKAMVASGDSNSGGSFRKLEKGEYTVKLQIRHEKRELLEKLNEVNMLACFKLANSISLEFYDHYNQCVIAGRKFTSGFVRDTKPRVIYVGSLTQERLSKANLPANCGWLAGALVLAKDENVRRVDTRNFLYIFTTAESGKKNGNGKDKEKDKSNEKEKVEANTGLADKAKQSAAVIAAPPPTGPTAGGDGSASLSGNTETTEMESPKKEKSTSDDYAEALFDFQCSMISKMEQEKADKLYQESIAARSKSRAQAHLAFIQNIETNCLKTVYPHTFVKSVKSMNVIGEGADENSKKEELQKTCSALDRIVLLTDLVIKEIDSDALLAYMGLKTDTRPDAAKIKTNMDKQKSNLLEALSKKGVAVAKLHVINDKLKDSLEELNNIYLEITKYVDANDSKVLQFSLWHAYAHEHYGRMFKYLQKVYEEKRARDCYEEFTYVVESLNYAHLETAVQRKFITGHPKSYRLF